MCMHIYVGASAALWGAEQVRRDIRSPRLTLQTAGSHVEVLKMEPGSSYSWNHRPSLQVNKSLNCYTRNHDWPTPELLAEWQATKST